MVADSDDLSKQSVYWTIVHSGYKDYGTKYVSEAHRRAERRSITDTDTHYRVASFSMLWFMFESKEDGTLLAVVE